MTHVKRSNDCGNSPKNQLVEDLSVALILGDQQTVSRLVTDDVCWIMVGGNVIQSRQAVLEALADPKKFVITELHIQHAITHGKTGAVNGVIQYQDAARGYCDIFEFVNARGTSVNQITSYRIDI